MSPEGQQPDEVSPGHLPPEALAHFCNQQVSEMASDSLENASLQPVLSAFQFLSAFYPCVRGGC